jgi:hypothetical protein
MTIYGMNFAPLAGESEQTETEVEGKLTSEIRALWSAHRIGKATVKRTKEELKTLRLDLGGKLYEMKVLLARCGRGGGWAAYLRSQDLPRATAERYIKQLNPKQIDSSETFSEPDEEDVRRLARRILPKLRKALKTATWMELFLVELQYLWERADADSTDARVDEAGPAAQGDSGSPSETEMVLLSAAA